MRAAQQLVDAPVIQGPVPAHVGKLQERQVSIEERPGGRICPNVPADLQRGDNLETNRQLMLKRQLRQPNSNAAALSAEVVADESKRQRFLGMVGEVVAARGDLHARMAHVEFGQERLRPSAALMCRQEACTGVLRYGDDCATAGTRENAAQIAEVRGIFQTISTRQMRFETDDERRGRSDRNTIERVNEIEPPGWQGVQYRDCFDALGNQIERQEAPSLHKMARMSGAIEGPAIAYWCENSQQLKIPAST